MRSSILGWHLLFVLAFLTLHLSGASVASAATPAKEEAKKKSSSAGFEFNKKDPIYITSDWMEVDQKNNTITYKGRVVTIQADMTMRSETLTAYYDQEMKQMKQIIAEGKVNATQGNRVATGQKAVFDDQAKTVILTGSPIMRQGNNQISGSKVIYFVEQDRAVAEGDGKVRVQATIFSEELGNKPDKGESASSN